MHSKTLKWDSRELKIYTWQSSAAGTNFDPPQDYKDFKSSTRFPFHHLVEHNFWHFKQLQFDRIIYKEECMYVCM